MGIINIAALRNETDNSSVEVIDIGPQCFADGHGRIINWKGYNFYRACDIPVTDLADGGHSFCVKRYGHTDNPGSDHEDYQGNTLKET